jgi:hypothetical protein
MASAAGDDGPVGEAPGMTSKARFALGAVALCLGVLAPAAEAGGGTPLRVRPGVDVVLDVAPGGADLPAPAKPVRATRPGDLIGFTLRDNQGATVAGRAYLSLSGNDLASELDLLMDAGRRLPAGRYTLRVSGTSGTDTVLALPTGMKVRSVRQTSRRLPRHWEEVPQPASSWTEPLPSAGAARLLVLFTGGHADAKTWTGTVCAKRDSSPTTTCERSDRDGSHTDVVSGGDSGTWHTLFAVYRLPSAVPLAAVDGKEISAHPTDTTFHGWALFE